MATRSTRGEAKTLLKPENLKTRREKRDLRTEEKGAKISHERRIRKTEERGT